MLDTWHHREFLHGITSAIHEHAEKISDERMFWVGVASFVTTVAIAAATVILMNRQAKIMEQQNKIALFKERYEYFNVLKKLSLNVTIVKNAKTEFIKEIEPKLKDEYKTEYHKLRLCIIAFLRHDILDFDEEHALAKYDIYSYSNSKYKELLDLIYPIRYVFEFDHHTSKELTTLMKIMINIFTEPTTDKVVTLNNNFEKLENFFETSPLYEHLEKQVYIIDNLKYFHDDLQALKN